MERYLPQTLNEYVQVFWRRKYFFLGIFLSVLAVTAVVYPFLPKYFKSSALLVAKEDKMIQTLGKGYQAESLDTKISILSVHMRSRSNMNRLKSELQSSLPVTHPIMSESPLRIGRRVGLTVLPGKLVRVSFLDKDPQVAQRAANLLATHLCSLDNEEKENEAKSAIKFIEDQLQLYKSKIQDTEKTSVVNRVNLQLEEMLRRRSLLLEQISQMEKSMVPQYKDDNPHLFKMQTELSELQGKLRMLQTKARSDSPMVQELTDKIQSLENVISIEKEGPSGNINAPMNQNYIWALAELKQVNHSINTLKKNQTDAESRGARSTLAEEEMLELEREKNVNEDIYKSLLKDLSNAQLVYRQSVSNAQGSFRIIELADLPQSPAWPTPLQMTGAGFVLALLIGAGLILLKEYKDTSFRGAADMESYVKRPLLGSIPKIDWKKNQSSRPPYPIYKEVPRNIVVLHNPRSLLSEHYRLLIAQLLSLSKNRTLQTVLVSSAVGDEGKTTTTMNLAFFLACELNKKVLLMDCDARQGSIAKTLDLPQKDGLFDYLAGNTPAESIFKQFKFGQLTVITAGASLPNPARYLSSSTMEKLIKDVREQYEFVIMDAPPVLSLADVPLLSNYADGIVLVVEAGRTPREYVSQAEHVLEKTNKENMLGYVLTGAEEEWPYSHRNGGSANYK